MFRPQEKNIDPFSAEIEKLFPITTMEEITQIRAGYFEKMSELRLRIEESSKKTEVSNRKQLEYSYYRCLHSYASYRLIKLAPPSNTDVDNESYNSWLIQLDETERSLNCDDTSNLENWLTHHRLKVFLLAIKTHCLIITKQNPMVIFSALLHFACEVQNYKNYAEQGLRIISNRDIKNDNLINLLSDSINLFSYVKKHQLVSHWSLCTAKAMGAVFDYTADEKKIIFSDNQKRFIQYIQLCFNNECTFDPKVVPEVCTDFLRRICLEIPYILSSQKKQIDPALKNDSLRYGKLLFLRLQLIGISLREPQKRQEYNLLDILHSIQRRLEEKLPLLWLYRFILGSSSILRFLEVETALEIDMTASSKPDLETQETRCCLDFFKVLSEPNNDPKSLIELACLPTSNTTKHLLIYFLIGDLRSRDECIKLLKKNKLPKHEHPMILSALETLSSIFNVQLTIDQKVRSVGNYLHNVKTNPAPKKFFLHMASFFLICKSSLALEDLELTNLIYGVLFGVKPDNIKNRPKPKSDEDLIKELQSQSAVTKKKTAKKKKKQNKKQQNPQQEMNVIPQRIVEELPVVFELIYPKKIKGVSFQPILGKEITIVTPPTILPLRAQPLSVIPSLRQHLTTRRKLLPDVIYRTHRQPTYPLSEIKNLFNRRIEPNRFYKYAIFSFGSIHLGHADHIDLMSNCTLEEAQEILQLEKDALKINIINVKSNHPHLIITFKDYPKILIKISTMKDAGNRPLLDLVSETQRTLDFLPNSLFHISLGNVSFVLDFNKAVKTFREKPYELFLISENHDEKNTILFIFGAINFISKYTNFKIPQALNEWIVRNKLTLQSRYAIHPFVKLLYSGTAYRSLLLLQHFGLLKLLSKPMDDIVYEKSDFMIWVQNFDLQYSHGFKFAAIENYFQIFTDVVALFFFPTQEIPRQLNSTTKSDVLSRWSFWSHPQPLVNDQLLLEEMEYKK